MANYEHDVFLSFRGPDVRKTFVSHLYDALDRRGIRTFIDDEGLEKGKTIYELFNHIERSRFSIIIFSKKYASSSWCLNELLKIMECRKMPDRIAYPLFHNVKPSQICDQSGPVGKAFAKLSEENDAQKWRDAMKEAGDLAGWVLKNTADGHEAKFIKIIVEHISRKLRAINIYNDKTVIGMELRIQKIMPFLTDLGVQMIGIKGIGGGGKTTLAKAIFSRVSTQYEAKSFVENVRKVSKGKDVLEGGKRVIDSVDYGKRIMVTTLRCKKILVVLDDVDDLSQLEALADRPDWFKDGSRIIVTTRDEQVLRGHWVKSGWMHRLHDVDLLSSEETLCLFSRYAFGRDIPDPGYEELLPRVVSYAGGLPLIIRLLGASLCGLGKEEWEDQLAWLEIHSLQEALDELEWSYEGLDADIKEMFLDVACLLKGLPKNKVIRIFESCGFNPIRGLGVLQRKSLITISDDQRIGIHDCIQRMAWNIVQRVDLDKPCRHSRLWIRQEIEDILASDEETDQTRAIALTDSYVELTSTIVTKGFGNMTGLRSLLLDSDDGDDCSHWDQKSTRHNFPITMRYLGWKFYPYTSLPDNLQADYLVALELPNCNVRQLWGGKDLTKLRFLVLSNSQLRILDLGLIPNLEILDLEGCHDLIELRAPNGCLKKLSFLNLSGCSHVKDLLFISRLQSLKVVSLTRLGRKDFKDIIPEHSNSSLEELLLRNNDIEELPPSIENLEKLVYLDLRDCINLNSLPGSICSLGNLKNLELYGCSLMELPDDIGQLVSLEELNLSGTRIRYLPNSTGMLKCLKKIDLSSCIFLESLPENLGGLECLESLILAHCTKVRCIPNSICQLECLKYFSVLGCTQLKQMPKELGYLKCLEELNVCGTQIRQLPKNLYLLSGLKIHESKPLLESHGHAYSRKRKFDHR